MMAAYVNGDKSSIPASKLQIIPTVIIGKDDVDKYAANLKAMSN
jgi:ribose transport system substrate-binding protein